MAPGKNGGLIMDIITSKEAIQKTNNAISEQVAQTIEKLLPIINEKIEAACATARFQTDVDVTKYQHTDVLGARICAELERLGYKCRLIDEYESGRYVLAISWAG